MTTSATHAPRTEPIRIRSLSDDGLPPLGLADRFALRLGVVLILWGQHHAERAERTEHARRNRAALRASSAAADTFSRRALAGPRF